jgi:hypothetical protein
MHHCRQPATDIGHRRRKTLVSHHGVDSFTIGQIMRPPIC